MVFRWEAPLFFANSGQFRDQVRALVRDRTPGWVVLQCEAVTDIDVTAAEMLRDLDEELNAKGVHLAFAELRDRLQDLVVRYGLHTTLDREHFYPSLDQALADIQPRHRLRTTPHGADADAPTGAIRGRRTRNRARPRPTRAIHGLALLLAMAMFVLVVDTSLMNVSISAVRAAAHRRQRPGPARLAAEQFAGLFGLANSFRMMRLPDLTSAVPLEGTDFG